MSVEEIKRLQEEQRRKQELERLATQKRIADEKQRKIDYEAKLLRQRQERDAFIRRKTDEIATHSGLYVGLHRIQKELLDGKVKKHTVVTTVENTPTITLVWGNRFDTSEGYVKLETVSHFFYKEHLLDCSSIRITIDVDTEDIVIGGWEEYRLQKTEWQRDIQKVNAAIAKAYLNPRRNNMNEKEEKAYLSSASTSNTECCNS